MMTEYQKNSSGSTTNNRDEIRLGKRPVENIREGAQSRSYMRNRAKYIRDSHDQLQDLVLFPPLSNQVDKVNLPEGQELSGWNSLFKDPKKVRKEKLLDYFKPLPHSPEELPFVLLSNEAVMREVKHWERCLVAYVVGKRPHFQALRCRLESQWKLLDSFQMHSLPNGFFLFKFHEEADRDRVLWEGPWSFYGRPLVVKEWREDLVMEKEMFNSLPIWIRLPNLDLRFWDLESLGRIASVVGHPRFIDDATADRERLAYARICVEITPQCEFPTTVKILIGTNVSGEKQALEEARISKEGWTLMARRKVGCNNTNLPENNVRRGNPDCNNVEQIRSSRFDVLEAQAEMSSETGVITEISHKEGADNGVIGLSEHGSKGGVESEFGKDIQPLVGSIESEMGEENQQFKAVEDLGITERAAKECANFDEGLDYSGLDGSAALDESGSMDMEGTAVVGSMDMGGTAVVGVPVVREESRVLELADQRALSESSNFVSHRGVRRSPRIRNVASTLVDMINPKSFEPLSSGKKKSKSGSCQ